MSEAMTRKELLDLLAKSEPKTRNTSMRVIEGKVDQDGAAYIHEKVDFVDSDLTVRSVDFTSSRTCSFGHLQDQKVRLLSVCEVCAAYTCSWAEDGSRCSFTCVRCGRAICKNHTFLHAKKDAYCPQCKWYGYLMVALNVLKRIVK
jgi:hypothetical protein